MRISIEEHEKYPCLEAEEIRQLYESGKKNLKVGFEIELNTRYPDEDRIQDNEAYEILEEIRKGFEEKCGFQMGVGKGVHNKKKVKRTFSDGITRVEIPFEVDSDGYKEHLLVPYSYYDGSTPVELVTSPIEPSIKKVKEAFETIQSVTDDLDTHLIPICFNKCGLHQTVVFEHLDPKFPETAVANAIQITRAFLPGIFYLLSSGTKECPTRSLEHRGHNQSIWHRQLNAIAKYSIVFPRGNRKAGNPEEWEYWGIEYRYPDGTQSKILPGVMSIINTAITLKAIKLSQFGVLKIPEDYYRRAKAEILKFTDYKTLTDDDLQSNSFLPKIISEELVQFLSEEIISLDKSSMSIIKKLIDKPTWLRVDRESEMTSSKYSEIDNNLMNRQNEVSNTSLEKALILDTSACRNRRNAVRRIANKIKKSYAETTKVLKLNNYIWSQKMARFVLRE